MTKDFYDSYDLKFCLFFSVFYDPLFRHAEFSLYLCFIFIFFSVQLYFMRF